MGRVGWVPVGVGCSFQGTLPLRRLHLKLDCQQLHPTLRREDRARLRERAKASGLHRRAVGPLPGTYGTQTSRSRFH